jgi:predicted PurR-regulated permease PerM
MTTVNKIKTRISKKANFKNLSIGYAIFIIILMIGVGFLAFTFVIMSPVIVDKGQELVQTIITAIKEALSNI